MYLIKNFFKGFLIVLFLPVYWFYAIIWFIAFRGKLNGYPRVKKDETAKHLILMFLSISSLVLFMNAFLKENAAKETAKADNKYIELTEFSSVQNEEQIYNSLHLDESIENIVGDESGEKTAVTEIENSSSKGISPYYHPKVEEDYTSEQTSYESSVQFKNNYGQNTDEFNNTKEDTNNNSQSENYTMVWIDDTAERYHSKNGCGMDNAYQVTIKEALDKGRTPCGRCYK